MPGEKRLLHKYVFPGCMILRGYQISWVSASSGVIWHKPGEIKGTTADYFYKGSGSTVPEIKSTKLIF